MTPKQKKYLKIMLWSHACLAASVPLFLLLAYLTRAWGFFRVGECYYRLIFHIYCPGCGGTRAVGALVRFQIAEAFSYSPGLFLVMAVILWFDFWILFSIVKRRESWLRLAIPHIFWVALIGVILISVIRTVLAYTVGYDPLGDLTVT